MNKSYIEKYATDQMIEKLNKHKCIACGLCCKWEGYVFVYNNDIRKISSKLNLSNDDFLVASCDLIQWNFEGENQYRVALKRNSRNECIFLVNNLCSIHEFKPHICKAGPVGSHFIFNQENFWFYVNNSPSFNSEIDNNNIEFLEKLFVESWNFDYTISQINNLTGIISYLSSTKDTIKQITKINIDKRRFEMIRMTGVPTPEPPPPPPPPPPIG